MAIRLDGSQTNDALRQLNAQQASEGGQGFFGKLGRGLSVGLNVAAGAAKGTIESIKGEQDASGFFGGIAEGVRENQDWADVFEEITGSRPEGKVQKGLTFAANLVFDPINLIPLGPVAKGIKIGGKFVKNASITQKITKGITGTPFYQTFDKMFIGSHIPQGFKKLVLGEKRALNVKDTNSFEAAKVFWKGVPRESMDEIVEILNTGKQSLNPQANHLAAQLKGGLDEIYDELVVQGIAKEEFRINFYFPHQFEKYLKVDPSKYATLGSFRPTKPGFTKQRTNVEGWIKNAPEVLLRYEFQANKAFATNNLFENIVNKFGKTIDDLVETGVDDLGRVSYRDPKTGEIYKSVVKGISKDKWALKENVADEFNSFVRGNQTSPFWKKYNKVQNFWKASATSGIVIPNMGFNTMNLMGNFWNNFLGGVMNPFIYTKAAGQQIWKGKEFKKLKELGMFDVGQVTGDVDRIMSKVPSSQMARFFDGVFQAPRKLSNSIETNARLAHYLKKIGDGKSVDEAIDSMNKYLFDYTDLTDWERKWGKTIFPFYAWSRKNIPLQIEALVKQPHKFAIPFKTKKAIEEDELLGENAPVRFKDLAPWLQEGFGIKVPEWVSNRISDKGNALIWNPYLPFQDLSFFGDPIGEGVERISPFIKLGPELTLNKKFFNGAKITEEEGLTNLQKIEDYWDYFSGNIRIKRDFNKLTDEERSIFQSYLDVFGFKTSEVDVAKSVKFRKLEKAREKAVKTRRRGQIRRGERRF